MRAHSVLVRAIFVNPTASSFDMNDTHFGEEAFIGRIVFTNGSGEAGLNRSPVRCEEWTKVQ